MHEADFRVWDLRMRYCFVSVHVNMLLGYQGPCEYFLKARKPFIGYFELNDRKEGVGGILSSWICELILYKAFQAACSIE